MKAPEGRLEKILRSYSKKKVAVILEANLRRDNDLIKKRDFYLSLLNGYGGKEKAEEVVKLMKDRKEKESLKLLNSFEGNSKVIDKRYVPVIKEAKMAFEEYKKIENALEELKIPETIYGILLKKEDQISLILPITEEDLLNRRSIADCLFSVIHQMEEELVSTGRNFTEARMNGYLTLMTSKANRDIKDMVEKLRGEANKCLSGTNLELRAHISSEDEEVRELSKLLKIEKGAFNIKPVEERKWERKLPSLSVQKIADSLSITAELLQELKNRMPLTKESITDIAIITKEYEARFPEIRELLDKNFSLDEISALYIVREYYSLTYHEEIFMDSLVELCEEFNDGEVDEELIHQLEMLHDVSAPMSISEKIQEAIELKEKLGMSLQHICDIMEGKKDRLVEENPEE